MIARLKSKIGGGYKVFIGNLPESITENYLSKNGAEIGLDGGEKTYKWWIARR